MLATTGIIAFSSVQAATFQSAGSGSWQLAGTWSLTAGTDADGIPDNNDNVTILIGHTITTNGSFNAGNLTINNGGTLSFNTAFSYGYFETSLTNNGTISGVSGSIPYIYLNSATVGGTGSFASSCRILGRLGTSDILAGTTLDLSFPGSIYVRPGAVLRNFGDLYMRVNTTINETPTDGSGIFENHGFIDLNTDAVMTSGIFRAHNPGSEVVIRANANNIPQTESGYYDLTLVAFSSANTYYAIQDLVVVNDFNTANHFNTFVDFQGFDCNVGGDMILLGGQLLNTATFTFDGPGTPQLLSGTNVSLPTAVVVEAGAVLELTTSTIFYDDVTVNGTLDVGAANNALSLRGDLACNGTINPRNGTITFNGSAAQSISGSSQAEFYNLTLSNAAGASISGGAGILLNRALSTTAGTFDQNGLLTLNSTATLDAFIAANALISTTDNITVRRYIGAGVARYRDIAPPIAGAEATQWDDDFIISGPSFPDGCAYSSSGCYKSLMRYNATSQVYKKFSRPDTAITRGLGYEIFLGDDLNVFSGAVADVTGTYAFTTGSATLTARTAWNLVGNPFPSAIDFDLCTKGGGIGNYFYIYDPTTGNYEWYDGASGTSSGNVSSAGHISSGQGFWLYNSGGVNFLTVPQSSKITTTPVFVRSPRMAVTGTLSLVLSSNTTDAICRSVVDFTALTRDIAREDIQMLRVPLHPEVSSTPPTMAFVNESGELTRKDLRLEEDRVEIPVMYNAFKAGQYTIAAELIDAFDTYSCVQLLDNKTGEYTDLRRASYTFTSEGDGKDETRFTLIVSKDGDCRSQEPISVSLADFVSVRNFGSTVTVMIDNYPDMQEGSLTLYNSLGQVVNEPTRVLAEPYTYELFLPSDARGVYMVVVDFGTEKVVKKIVY